MKSVNIFYGWIIVILAFCALFSSGVTYSFGVFLKPMIVELGWSRATASLALSIRMAVGMFSTVFIGVIFDRYGPRIVIGCCGLLLGIGTLLCSQVNALWQLYLFYGIIVGIGVGGVRVPSVSTASRWFTKKKGLVLGIVTSGVGIGTLFTSPLAASLIANFGWRGAFAILGPVYGLLVIIISLFMKRDPMVLGLEPYGDTGEVNGDHLEQIWTAREAVKTRSFWSVYFTYFLGSIGVNMMMLHIVPYATDIGIPEVIAANALGFLGGCSVIGKIGMGILSDIIERKQILIICFLIQAILMALLIMMTSPWMLYVFAMVFGFAYGGWVPVFAAITSDFFGQASFGTVYGVLVTSFMAGGVVGPLIGGYVFDVTGNYSVAFLSGSAAYALGIGSCILIKKPNQKIAPSFN